MRYELHRVWVVEANLKAGSKHIYGKRCSTSTRTPGTS